MLIIDKNQKTNWKYILILLILAVIAGGGILSWQYFNKIRIKTPKIELIFPPQLAIPAYKEFSFSFTIKNKKDSFKVDGINIAIRGVSGEITPNDVNLVPDESKNFEVKLDKLEPGDYTLYLDISGKPNINITKKILIKSQIVVGFDQYHISEKFWKTPVTYPDQSGLKFINYLQENNIRTKIIESELNEDVLRNINVLILAKPDQPLLSEEKETLRKFLDRGNGLLLVGLFRDYMGSNKILNDLTEFLGINLKFNADYLFPDEWTKEISKYQITSGIESIIYRGCSLSVKEPAITLVKQNGKSVYAIQQYLNGKIGAIGGYFMLRDDHLNICRQCQKLNLNLIKWLSTPEKSVEEKTNKLVSSKVEEWKTYRNEEYGFEIKFPKEYSLKENVEKMTEFGEKGKYAEILVNQKIINASCYEVSVKKIYAGINTTDNNIDACAREKIFSPIKNENELSILSIQLKDKGWLKEKVINGILFYRRYSMSQAMGGKSYLDFGYQTFFSDKCYKVGVEVSENLYFGFKDECPPSLENSSIYQSLFKETDKKIQNIFFPILSTFQLLSTTTEPEEVVREFFEWYLGDWRYEHRKKVIDRKELTQKYKEELSEKFETTFTYDPVIFAQDIPDKGFTVGKASIGDKKALVVLTLKYSGMGEKNLLVELLLLNNQWKINNISSILSENEIPRG